MGSELLQSCVTLINEQHLQRQGWLAVVANLENIARYGMTCMKSKWNYYLCQQTMFLLQFVSVRMSNTDSS